MSAREAPPGAPLDRGASLERLRGETGPWDLVVIGGGATGLGAAVDAAARGYRTVLLEGHDLAKGTSSRSTKLVHGGVRYLRQGNVKLVREALHERGLLSQNAPHLVAPLGFVIPGYAWWHRPFYGLGLKLYDGLAGRLNLARSRRLSRDEARAGVPTLRAGGLTGGVRYHDAQFDDARLAVALARTAADHGAVVLNYVRVTGLRKAGGRVCGVEAVDEESGEALALEARVVVNATGVFSDAVRRLDEPGARALLAHSQGAHVVLERSFQPGPHALMVPRTDDGRVLFAIPWQGRVVVGTTDVPVKEACLEPRPLAEELDFLLTHAGRYLERAPEPADVRSAFAGLRPLVRAGGAGRTAALSRDHTLAVSRSGLVTVTGGKWTTYRRMAADAVDRAAQVGDLPRRPSPTAGLRLHGWRAGPFAEGHWRGYGDDLEAVRDVLAEPGGDEPLHPDLPYRLGEVRWAARCELARTVEDVLARRTRALLLDARASAEAAPRVAAALARELGRDEAWVEAQVETFQRLAAGYLIG